MPDSTTLRPDLNAIHNRLLGLTGSGRWHVRKHPRDPNAGFVECPKEALGTPYGQQILADEYDMSIGSRGADMEFVAHAPEDVAALLQYVAYLEGLQHG